MGITGLYAELGPGERISLAKLADDHLNSTGRPLRVAIDVSIWSFQVQAAQGGTNPALRTLYYRLTRLLTLPLLPLFVFDGPARPQFKRHRKTANVPAYITSRQKTLISLFGYPHHTAPGEAEAECAHLQKLGIVDVTLSEDVDTLMFGCGKILRNWSSESGGGSGVPTHVTVYDLDKVERDKGLTPEGMIMVALMSGGDYIPAGIPGCGVRTAVDAARAGFGTELCALGGRGDEKGLRGWRERLTHELRTNESKLFARKNSRIVIPESFPDKQVLGYYLKPVVSGEESLVVRRKPAWGGDVDWVGLRSFTKEVFEWKGKEGAKKLMRTLAAGVLVGKLFNGGEGKGKRVKELVEKITGRRVHHSTDGLAELRVAYIPGIVVPIDLHAEPDDGDGSCAGVDEGEDGGDVGEADEDGKGGRRKAKDYDPLAIERVWISERVLRMSVSEIVEEWEEGLNKPKKKVSSTAGTKKGGRAKAADKDAGAIEKLLKASKPTAAVAKPANRDADTVDEDWWIPPPKIDIPQFKPPPISKAPGASKKQSTANLKGTAAVTKPASKAPSKASVKPAPGPSPPKGENPWTLAAKRPPVSNRTNTVGVLGATAATAAKSKSQVKARSVSESILSSPLPTPAKRSSKSRSRSPLKASSPTVENSPLVGLSKFKKNIAPSASKDNPTCSRPSRSKPFDIPSSPPPLAEDLSNEPPSPELPSLIHIHGSKRQRKPSPPIEVIDLLSSSPPPCFSADTSPVSQQRATDPSSVPGTPSRKLKGGCEESPSKKQKTPESVRRASLPTAEDLFDTPASASPISSKRLSGGFILPSEPLHEEESSFDYDESISAFGYDKHFGFYNQDDIPSPPAVADSRTVAIGKVNRRLDFSAPLPPPEEFTQDTFFHSEPLSQLPPLDTNFPPSSSAYAHSRNGSTASTASSSALSDFSIPISTPTSVAERQPVRDFSWITTTRGNFSPRKQLKRVMEGVFPSTSPLSPNKEELDSHSHSPIGLGIYISGESKSKHRHRDRPAKNLSPIEALQEIMNAPTPPPPVPPVKELQQPPDLGEDLQSRSSSRASEGSMGSLGPGFDEQVADLEEASAAPEQVTPPRRRMKSMIPVPSAKKSKSTLQALDIAPASVAAPAPAPAPAPVAKQVQKKDSMIKPRPSQQRLQSQPPPPPPPPPPPQLRKTASAPPPSTTITSTKAPQPPKPQPKKLSIRQSTDSGLWRALEDDFEVQLGAMQTIGRKGGLEVKRSLGRIRVWEEVEVVDLTGE